MATAPPPAKRVQPSTSRAYGDVRQATLDAQSVAFPWTEAVPEKIRKWFETYAKAHNTAPEYVFMGSLVTAAVIMGPRSFVQVRDTY